MYRAPYTGDRAPGRSCPSVSRACPTTRRRPPLPDAHPTSSASAKRRHEAPGGEPDDPTQAMASSPKRKRQRLCVSIDYGTAITP